MSVSTSIVKFGDKISGSHLEICISQSADPQYGMYLWPAAPVLAQYVWSKGHYLENKSVLEIGAGTALPGIVADKLGASVILSDGDGLKDCIKNCKRSCEMNNCHNIKVIGITWGEVGPDLLNLPKIDIILGSDCFYDTKDFEDVIATVSYILDKNPGSEFWTSYQVRSSSRCIKPLLQKWKRQAVQVPLSDFDADTDNIAESGLPGPHVVELYIIK